MNRLEYWTNLQYRKLETKKIRIQDASCKHFGKIIDLGTRIENTKQIRTTEKFGKKEDEDPRCIVQTFRKNHTSRYTNREKSYQKSDRSQIVRDFMNFKNHTSRYTNRNKSYQKSDRSQIVRDFINFISDFGVSNWGSESDDQKVKQKQNHSKSLFLFLVASGTGKINPRWFV